MWLSVIPCFWSKRKTNPYLIISIPAREWKRSVSLTWDGKSVLRCHKIRPAGDPIKPPCCLYCFQGSPLAQASWPRPGLSFAAAKVKDKKHSPWRQWNIQLHEPLILLQEAVQYEASDIHKSKLFTTNHSGLRNMIRHTSITRIYFFSRFSRHIKEIMASTTLWIITLSAHSKRWVRTRRMPFYTPTVKSQKKMPCHLLL